MNTNTPNFQLLLNDIYGLEKAKNCTLYDICCVVEEIDNLCIMEKYILIEKYGLADGVAKQFNYISNSFNETYPNLNKINYSLCKSYFRKIMNYLKRELNPYIPIKNNKKITVEEFGLRIYNALRRNGITEFKQLTELTEKDLLQFENIGVTIVKQIKSILSSVGLGLKNEYSETSGTYSLLID